jgi:hypothetical protein
LLLLVVVISVVKLVWSHRFMKNNYLRIHSDKKKRLNNKFR